jgi:hypothetical protein
MIGYLLESSFVCEEIYDLKIAVRIKIISHSVFGRRQRKRQCHKQMVSAEVENNPSTSIRMCRTTQTGPASQAVNLYSPINPSPILAAGL